MYLKRRNEAASKPRKEFVPKTLADLNLNGEATTQHQGLTTPTPGLNDGLNGNQYTSVFFVFLACLFDITIALFNVSGLSNTVKTPAVSPASAPSWDPFSAANAAPGSPLTAPDPFEIAWNHFEFISNHFNLISNHFEAV